MRLKNRLFLTVNLLIFVLIFCFEAYISRYGCLFNDDIHFGILYENENIWNLLFKNAGIVHGGGFMNIFLTKFFCTYLPLSLHIHPADFAVFPMCVVKASVIAFLCSAVSNFTEIYCRNKILHSAAFLFCAFFYFAGLNDSGGINDNTLNFFRYNFSVLIFAVFWLYIINNILKKPQKINPASFAGVLFCGLILGSNLEICIFSSVLTVCMLLIYTPAGRLFHFRSTGLYNLNLNFSLPAVFLLAAALLFIQSAGFKSVSADRGLGITVLSAELVSEFFEKFYRLYILDFLWFWVIFFVLAGFSLAAALKTHSFKRALLPLFIEAAIVLSYISLILCGKTAYSIDKFWIERENLIFVFKIMSCMPLFLLTGYTARCNRALMRASVLLFVFLSGYFYAHINDNFLIEQNQTREVRRVNYIYDKLYQFYYLKNSTPIVPEDRNNTYYGWTDYHKTTAEYLNAVYNQKLDTDKFNVIIDKNALEHFKEAGGVLTEEELKNPEFSKLWDEKFVLNGAA